MSSSADILQVAVVLRVVCLLFLLCFEAVVRLPLFPKAVPPLSKRFNCFTKPTKPRPQDFSIAKLFLVINLFY